VIVASAVVLSAAIIERSDTAANAAGGALTADSLSLPNFNLLPGGVLEWPGKVRMSYGGGESSALPNVNGKVRAQPGGNLVLQPLGDYKRSALDLLPTQGKMPDIDAIAELTIHRIHPTPSDQEMISYSALGREQDRYAVIVEAHGKGRLKPLSFMTVQGGLPSNPNQRGFAAEAMRMTEDGTMVFGSKRRGGRLKRPLDSITIEQPEPEVPGTYDSDFLKWVGKSRDGRTEHQANWRANVQVEDKKGRSSFVLYSGIDGGPYRDRLKVRSGGDVEVSGAGAAVILRSPNGKRWRLSVDNSGRLEVTPAR